MAPVSRSGLPPHFPRYATVDEFLMLDWTRRTGVSRTTSVPGAGGDQPCRRGRGREGSRAKALTVRRFVCSNPACEVKTFAEQVAGLSERYRRPTVTLQGLEKVGTDPTIGQHRLRQPDRRFSTKTALLHSGGCVRPDSSQLPQMATIGDNSTTTTACTRQARFSDANRQGNSCDG